MENFLEPLNAILILIILNKVIYSGIMQLFITDFFFHADFFFDEPAIFSCQYKQVNEILIINEFFETVIFRYENCTLKCYYRYCKIYRNP